MVKYTHNENLDFVFMALANPTRRGILSQLIGGRSTAQDLARPYQMSLPAISKHLKVLENADLISREVEGRKHLFSVKTKRLQEASNWVSKFEVFWSEKLENLEIFLDSEE